jgi:hypothetical protein
MGQPDELIAKPPKTDDLHAAHLSGYAGQMMAVPAG